MRQVHTNENLMGQVLTGPARESYFEGCNLTQCDFVGDWRGTTFHNNLMGAADLSQMQSYATSFTGGNDLSGVAMPADLGYMDKHEPFREIVKREVLLTANTTVRQIAQQIADRCLDPLASWDTTRDLWWDGRSATVRQRVIDRFNEIFAPYPKAVQRFRILFRQLQNGENLYTPKPETPVTLTWPDGATVTIDPANPPIVTRDRYVARQWIQGQANVQQPANPHWVFVYTLRPLVIQQLAGGPEDWLTFGYGGY